MQIGLIKPQKEVQLIQSKLGNIKSNFYYKPKVGLDITINKRERERVSVIVWCVYMVEVLLVEFFFLDKGFIVW